MSIFKTHCYWPESARVEKLDKTFYYEDENTYRRMFPRHVTGYQEVPRNWSTGAIPGATVKGYEFQCTPAGGSWVQVLP